MVNIIRNNDKIDGVIAINDYLDFFEQYKDFKEISDLVCVRQVKM